MSTLGNLMLFSFLRPGLYAFYDYLGYAYNLNGFRVLFSSLTIFINILLIGAYIYMLRSMYKNDQIAGFDHSVPVRFAFLIVSIIVLLVVFLIRFFSNDDLKKDCTALSTNDNRIIIGDKLLILINIGYIFYLLYRSITSGKKIKEGKYVSTYKRSRLYFEITILTVLSIITMYQLPYLTKKYLSS